MRIGHTYSFRLAYAAVALYGALFLFCCGVAIKRVMAQDKIDYATQAQVAVDSKMLDQVVAGQTDTNHRLDGEDARLNELSDRVSEIQGAGGAILLILGGLQILGLLKTRGSDKEVRVV